jgi:hypothetical protein
MRSIDPEWASSSWMRFRIHPSIRSKNLISHLLTARIFPPQNSQSIDVTTVGGPAFYME